VQQLFQLLGIDAQQRLVRLIRPSLTISTEVRTRAVAFILPLRVCRQYSVPFSMVYSKSWTSR
jgi:hypothetical protein